MVKVRRTYAAVKAELVEARARWTELIDMRVRFKADYENAHEAADHDRALRLFRQALDGIIGVSHRIGRLQHEQKRLSRRRKHKRAANQ